MSAGGGSGAISKASVQPAMADNCGCSLCAPDERSPDARGRQPSGLWPVCDYPSQTESPHFSPIPLLLDSCVIQHFLWARHRAPALGDSDGWERVRLQFGRAMGKELEAVHGLLVGVEESLGYDEGPPFVVSRTSWEELSRAPRDRRDALLDEWRRWRARACEYADAFNDERVPHPMFSTMPEVLGWPMPSQLTLFDEPREQFVSRGPFHDPGDVSLIREAQSLSVPAILTTDLRSFWRYRRWLYSYGVEIWRPSDVCRALWSDALLVNGQFGPMKRPGFCRDSIY